MIGGRPATLPAATGCFLLAENETFDQTWHYRSHLKTAMKMGLLSWFFMLYVPTALCEWTFSHKLATNTVMGFISISKRNIPTLQVAPLEGLYVVKHGDLLVQYRILNP